MDQRLENRIEILSSLGRAKTQQAYIRSPHELKPLSPCLQAQDLSLSARNHIQLSWPNFKTDCYPPPPSLLSLLCVITDPHEVASQISLMEEGDKMFTKQRQTNRPGD